MDTNKFCIPCGRELDSKGWCHTCGEKPGGFTESRQLAESFKKIWGHVEAKRKKDTRTSVKQEFGVRTNKNQGNLALKEVS